MAQRYSQERWDQPLFGDPLYGDREALRRYRDFARDEHRRFAADSERDQGITDRRDALIEYDRMDPDRIALALPNRDPRPRPQRGRRERRGPANYRRPDQRIYEDVCQRLTDDDRIDASEIEVHVSNCEVTLTGHVRSRTAKRRSTQVAEDVFGVREVFNNIRISDEQV